MNAIRALWRSMFPRPVEKQIREVLETQGPLDGIVVLKSVTPFWPTRVDAEWRCRKSDGKFTWRIVGGKNRDALQEGTRVVTADRIHELSRRLDELHASGQTQLMLVKDGTWYSIGWLSASGKVQSIEPRGTFDGGACANLIREMSLDLPAVD